MKNSLSIISNNNTNIQYRRRVFLELQSERHESEEKKKPGRWRKKEAEIQLFSFFRLEKGKHRRRAEMGKQIECAHTINVLLLCFRH